MTFRRKFEKSDEGNLKLLSPLTEFESLIELFSFFTSVTSNNSRSICKWWNNLLTKDKQTITQIYKNNKSQENFNLFYNDHKISNKYLKLKNHTTLMTGIKIDCKAQQWFLVDKNINYHINKN
jgi:hypothetical protein